MSDGWEYRVIDPEETNEHMAALKKDKAIFFQLSQRDLGDMQNGKWIVIPWGGKLAVILVLKELAPSFEHIMRIGPGKNGTVD